MNKFVKKAMNYTPPSYFEQYVAMQNVTILLLQETNLHQNQA